MIHEGLLAGAVFLRNTMSRLRAQLRYNWQNQL